MPRRVKVKLVQSHRYRNFKQYLNKGKIKKTEKFFKDSAWDNVIGEIGNEMKFDRRKIQSVIGLFKQHRNKVDNEKEYKELISNLIKKKKITFTEFEKPSKIQWLKQRETEME